MNGFISLGVVSLCAVIVASLQLSLGTLLLLYHSSMGSHIHAKTKQLVGSYIAGATLMVFLLLCASCFIIPLLSFSSTNTLSDASLAVIVGILLALAIISWFFYYKRKNSTELWLPRGIAKHLDLRAKNTSSPHEAFSLGLITPVSEIIFSGILIILAANFILQLDIICQTLALVGFTIIAILPLLILRIVIRNGKNVADVQRWRLKNKTFFRFFTGFGFLVLAGFLLAFAVMGVAK